MRLWAPVVAFLRLNCATGWSQLRGPGVAADLALVGASRASRGSRAGNVLYAMDVDAKASISTSRHWALVQRSADGPVPAPAPPAESLLTGANTSTASSSPATTEVTTTTACPCAQTTTESVAPYANTSSSEAPTIAPASTLSATEEEKIKEIRLQQSLNCNVSEWSEWGDCVVIPTDITRSKMTTRTRKITQPHLEGGVPCPLLQQKRSCVSESGPFGAVSAG
mmetsp:Transcript_62123/g.134881  ORF Transcript_62123/g.134881 Transcript_62123/m.134881 type:complete len:224 (+) Transcript_62123:65-736(+)